MIMKVRSLLFSMLCMLALGASVASCSDDDGDLDDDGSKVTLPQTRAFFLNQGSWGGNNAGISFYAPNKDAEFVNDIFKKQNNAALGDNAQDMIEYEERIYVAVNTSNYLAMLNAAGVEQGRISFVNDADLSAGIRYLSAEDGYIYASFYNGFVVKINANTLELETKLGGLGDCLEEMAICDDVLYVANSYKQEGGNWIYHTNVVTVDLHTFKKTGDITVATNPNRMVEEDDKVFLLSIGDYVSIGATLQMIEPKNNNKVTTLGSAVMMCAENGKLYWIDGTEGNICRTYDIKSGKQGTIDLPSQASDLKSATIMMLEVNEENGDIYVSTSDYVTNGNIYRFKQDGTLVEKFDAGGINPVAAVFFN